MPTLNKIEPQEDFQYKFLSSKANIAIGGGAAGAGKTFSLLLDAVRHHNDPTSKGIIFRRTTPQITNPGALWDESNEIYPLIGGSPNISRLKWTFESGSEIKFSHLEHEKNVLDYQGSQFTFVGFDELTHFTESQFFYMLSRLRTTGKIKPYVRATCNPDPESWVARFIDWWIDPDTGFPIPERCGKLRYFIKDQNNYVWGTSVQEIEDQAPHIFNDEAFKDRGS